jgi:tetrahydromethanopterin S-methyltransferase subunit G
MISMKHDLFSGILYGIVIGLFFAPTLSAHVPLMLLLAVLVGTKLIKV